MYSKKGVSASVDGEQITVTLSRKQAYHISRFLGAACSDQSGGGGWATMRDIAANFVHVMQTEIKSSGYVHRMNLNASARAKRKLGPAESGLGRVYSAEEIAEYERKNGLG